MNLKKDKKAKVMAILTLCISVLGLTLGFAAFSNTLTISSSATVSPDESDFKITVLGVTPDIIELDEESESLVLDITQYNEFTSKPLVYGEGASATVASIDNENLVLNNISASFKTDDQNVTYYFALRNDGEYDAYLDLESLKNMYEGKTGTCTPGAGTSADLVNQTCQSIKLSLGLGTADSGIDIINNTSYKLEKGEHIFLGVVISYDDARVFADGDFTVAFDDIQLDFSTTE